MSVFVSFIKAMDSLFHVGPLSLRGDLRGAQAYYPDRYEQEGFTHCSYRHQLPGVLDRYFADAGRLIVLEIDRNKIVSKIIDESSTGAEELFPHIYGPIEVAAITQMHDIVRGSDGRFDLSDIPST